MMQLACLLTGRIHAVDLSIELQLLEMVLAVLRFKLRLHADRSLHRDWIVSDRIVVHHRRWYHPCIHGLHLRLGLLAICGSSCRTHRVLVCIGEADLARVFHLNELAWLDGTYLIWLLLLNHRRIRGLVQKRKLLRLQALIATLLGLCVS